MALDSLRSAGGAPYAADSTVAGHAGAAPFEARAGRAKRLLRLARDMRHASSVRGSLALLYASLGTDSRVRAIQKWSDSERGASLSQDDMRRLCDRVARRCPEPAQAPVFYRITREYCQRADTGQLASLRRTLDTASRGRRMAGPGAAGRSGTQGVGNVVRHAGRELARRTPITPLRQMAQALSACIGWAGLGMRPSGGKAGAPGRRPRGARCAFGCPGAIDPCRVAYAGTASGAAEYRWGAGRYGAGALSHGPGPCASAVLSGSLAAAA